MSQAQAIVIGVSAGALEALSAILPALPQDYALPVIVVVHLPPHKESILADLLQTKCRMKVCEAEDKDALEPGTIYIAPPDYHLLVEQEKILSLSSEEEILFSRPSINALFETAADAYGENLIGIVLTGANNDGADGLAAIAKAGGATIVQDPSQAQAALMPLAALKACPDAKVLSLKEIAIYLIQATSQKVYNVV